MGNPRDREWEDEPDRIEYTESGLKALILRTPEIGILCGYVALPLRHPLAGKKYDDMPILVHGGLTFGNEGDEKLREKGYFLYGFDCGHHGDFAPQIVQTLEEVGISSTKHWYEDTTYRNVAYVRQEIKYMVKQFWRAIYQWIGMEVAIGAAMFFVLIILAIALA